jgi:hypothetical protein
MKKSIRALTLHAISAAVSLLFAASSIQLLAEK